MKKALLSLSALLLISNVAAASPVMNLEKGEVAAGYSFWNPTVDALSYDLGGAYANGVFIETGINDKTAVGFEFTQGSMNNSGVYLDTSFLDLSLKQKLNENVQLIVGGRTYDSSVIYGAYSASTSSTKLFYGVGLTNKITDSTSAYANILINDISTDYQIGVNYSTRKNVALNMNYRSYTEDDLSLQGIGLGVSCKF